MSWTSVALIIAALWAVLATWCARSNGHQARCLSRRVARLEEANRELRIENRDLRDQLAHSDRDAVIAEVTDQVTDAYRQATA